MNWTDEQYAEHLAKLVTGGKAQPSEAVTRLHNKYGVAPRSERTVEGRVFASKAEATAYQELLMIMAAGALIEIELQPRFPFPMGFSYVADFRVTWADGRIEVIDVKGMETPVFKLKRKCLEHFYPDVKLVLWKR